MKTKKEERLGWIVGSDGRTITFNQGFDYRYSPIGSVAYSSWCIDPYRSLEYFIIYQSEGVQL